jgi:chitinase
VANLEAQRRSLGYDGFDLDWETLEPSDLPALLGLASALRAAAAPTVITLTAPVGWMNVNYDDPTWTAPLASAFDQINVMSYGMDWIGGGWVSWHFAALFGEAPSHPSSVSSTMALYANRAGIPKAQLGIGIGFYGICYQGVTAPLQSTSGAAIVASDNEMSYGHIMASYYDPAAYHWDDAAKEGYLSFATRTGPAQCNLVSYEDAASIQAKGDWVRASGYGGTILWTVQQGALSPTGANPLLAAVKAAFLP